MFIFMEDHTGPGRACSSPSLWRITPARRGEELEPTKENQVEEPEQESESESEQDSEWEPLTGVEGAERRDGRSFAGNVRSTSRPARL